MSWTEQLEQASFRNVKFNIISCDDSLQRRIVEHEYPYRNGAELEDLGRKARPGKYVVVFFGEESLAELNVFMKVCDAGKTGKFVHPTLGAWQAKVINVELRQASSARDQIEVNLEIREDGVNTTLPDLFSINAAKAVLDKAVDNLSTAKDNLDVDIGSIDTLISDANDFSSNVDTIIDDPNERLNQIHDRTKTAIRDINTSIDDTSSWPVLTACRRCFATAQDIKEKLESLAPRKVSYDTVVEVPLAVLANTLYSDSERADDLLRMNKIKNPFLVPAATTLKVYDE